MNIASLALKNLSRQLKRSLVAASAIFFSTFAMMMVFGFYNGAVSDITHNLTDFQSGTVEVRQSRFVELERFKPLQYSITNYQEVQKSIEQLDGVVSVLPRIGISVQGFKSVGGIVENPDTVNFQFLGVDFDAEEAAVDFSSYMTLGQLPEKGEEQILISPLTADELDLGVGDRLTVLGLNANLSQSFASFTVSGIITLPSMMSGTLYTSLEKLQSFASIDGIISLNVIKEPHLTDGELKTRVQNILSEDLLAQELGDISGYYRTITKNGVFFFFIAFLFAFLASVVLLNTMTLIFYERVGELSNLHCLGMSKIRIAGLLFFELLYLSVTFLLLAFWVAIGLMQLIKNAGGLRMPDGVSGFGYSTHIFFVNNWHHSLTVLAFSLVIIFISSCFPIVRVLQVPLFEGLQGKMAKRQPKSSRA